MTRNSITAARGLFRRALAASAAAAGLMAISTPMAADVDIAGYWSGGGSVSFSGGTSEKARCRATYSKTGAASYTVNATCATASGKVSQSASVTRSGPSSFTGNFYNPDYDAKGHIHISVRGNSQNVKLSSSVASASLRLSR